MRVFAFALVAGILNIHPSSAAPTLPCINPANVPGVGRACPEGSYWRITLPDGSSYLTHGNDKSLPALRFANAGSSMPSCASNMQTEPYNILVYAHASNKPNLYGAATKALPAMAMRANAALEAEAAAFGRSMDFRFLCANGLLVVEDAPIALPNEQITFETLMTSVRALGFTSGMAKYWIWYECGNGQGKGCPPGTTTGVATLETDDRLAADNANNFGPSYAVTWGLDINNGGAETMLHEAAHTLGAVQNTAPNSTGAGHCTDGADLMCRADGGPSSGNYTTRKCAAVVFDCNHDDYFNPTPGASNYLATHWNLASPFNRYVAGCLYSTGLLAANGPDNKGVTSAVIAFGPGCQGHAFAASAMTPQPAGIAPAVSRAPSTAPFPDVNVCWYNGTRVIRCDDNLGAENGTVPANANNAHVVLATGIGAQYVLSII